MLSFLRLKHQREFEIELYNIPEGVCSDKELKEITTILYILLISYLLFDNNEIDHLNC